MWCIPPKQSGEFVYHMEDVLDVYHRPYDPKRPVVCLDETFKQLIGEVREPLPPGPGRVERYDSVYVRNGVASLFMTFEPLAGWRHAELSGSRTAVDWARVVKGLVDAPRYENAEVIVLVMDQLNTHGPWSLYEAFTPDEAKRIAGKLEIHYTPKHGSWLNMAEIELSAFERDLPERVGDRRAMAAHVSAWEKRRNGAKVKANWQFTTTDARVKLRKLYPTVDGFVPAEGVAHDFSALVIAAQIDGEMRCVGRVGAGFDAALRERINTYLWSHLREQPVVPCREKARWVDPGLYCTIRCMERTKGGQLRAPVFEELYGD